MRHFTLNPVPANIAKTVALRRVNRLGQYANGLGNRAYCYAELAVSSLAVAITIASAHYTYP